MKALFRIFAGSTNSRRMIIWLAAVFCLTVPAYGSVTVLWEQYHCYANMSDDEPSYSITDSNPISVGVLPGGSAKTQAWKYGAYAETQRWYGWAGASSTFVFTVDQPLLIIKYAGTLRSFAFPDTWGGISYELTDNLTKEVIGSQKWSLSEADEKLDKIGTIDHYRKTIEESISYNLVTGHEYKLLLSANVTNADGTNAVMSAVLVPEPSCLLLLGFGGLSALVLRRRI